MTVTGETFEVTASDEDAGQRLDRAGARALPHLSRARLQALIKAGHVSIDGVAATDGARKLRAGERIAVDVPPPVPAAPQPEAIALEVAYEDAHLLVVNKPAGLVVHPGSGIADGTMVNALIAHCGESLSGIGGVKRPGIVHRLDKDTSGLLVVAKSDVAHAGLSAQFAAHGRDGALEREYVAIVWGSLARPAGTIDAAIGRSSANRTRMAVSKGADARQAVTHYRVEETFAGGLASLIRVRLETGRTHQIRVHMAHIGHPLLGDATYGSGFATRAAKLSDAAAEALTALDRQALHAQVLGFIHPVEGRKLLLRSEPPADFMRLLNTLRGS